MEVVSPESAGFSSTRLQRISAKMQAYVDEGKVAGMITTQTTITHWRTRSSSSGIKRLCKHTNGFERSPISGQMGRAPATFIEGIRRIGP